MPSYLCEVCGHGPCTQTIENGDLANESYCIVADDYVGMFEVVQ